MAYAPCAYEHMLMMEAYDIYDANPTWPNMVSYQNAISDYFSCVAG